MGTNLSEQQEWLGLKKTMTSQEDLNTKVLFRTKVSQGWKANRWRNRNIAKNTSNIFERLLTTGEGIAAPYVQGIRQ